MKKSSSLVLVVLVSLLFTTGCSTATNPGLVRAVDASTAVDLIHKAQIRSAQAKIATSTAGIVIPARHFDEENSILQKGAIFGGGIVKQSLQGSYLSGVEKKAKK